MSNDLTAADFNGDSNLDLAVANSNDDNICIFLGNGNGNFILHYYHYFDETTYSIAFGDFNNYESDLESNGDLKWTNVKSDETVTDSFTVKNIGGLDSELNWEIIEWPEWGDWTFSPINGFGLKPEDGDLTIDVTVVSPDENNKEFTGEVKIVNLDDNSDYEIITVSLTTSRSKSSYYFPFLRCLEQFPLLERLLYFIL